MFECGVKKMSNHISPHAKLARKTESLKIWGEDQLGNFLVWLHE